MYRHHTSCFGRGLFIDERDETGGCGPASDGNYNGDEDQRIEPQNTHCLLDCSGPRDADFRQHADGIADTPDNHNCPLVGGPCASVHCVAAPMNQAAWDFAKYDLQQAPYNYDSVSAFIVASRLFHQGSGNVGNWFTSDCDAHVSSAAILTADT